MKKILSCLILFFGFAFVLIGCGDKTVYHTVSFETGGLISLQSQRLTDGELATEPSDINIEGYNFLGWFADSQFQSEFDFSQPIKSNITIYAKIERIEINITFNSEVTESYSIVKPSETTYYGDDYIFSILIDPAYNQSDASVWASLLGVNGVKVSSEIIMSGDNAGKRQIVFKFQNVKNDGKISVGGILLNKYTISLPENQIGYQLTSNVTKVNYNDEVKLTLKIDDNYNQSLDKFKIVLNKGEASELEIIASQFNYDGLKNEFAYTIKEIKNHLNISVEGVEINTFDVQDLSAISDVDSMGRRKFTLEWIEGVENNKAIINSTIKFKLTYHNYYNRSDEVITFKMGEESKTPTFVSKNGNERVYEISGVVGEISDYEISNIKINIYKITLTEVEGCFLAFQNTLEDERDAGSEVRVRVNKENGYDFSNAKIKYLGEEYSLKDINNIVINPLENDVEFEITGVEPILFDVSFAELPENIAIINQMGLYKETNKILKTKTYSFELEFAEGYELGTIKVFNNKNELVAENGVYEIENVSEDINITFTGEARLKVYTVGIEEGEGFYVNSWVENVTHGKSANFSIKVEDDYLNSLSEIEIYANETKIDHEIEGSIVKFELNQVKCNITIVVKKVTRNRVAISYANFEECSVNYYLEDGQKNKFKEDAEVEKIYSFYVVLKSEYQNDRSGIVITIGGEQFGYASCGYVQDLGAYVCVFNNISIGSSDLGITISGYKKNVYAVSKEDKEDSSYYSIELLTGATVKHGEDVTFAFTIDENYEAKVDPEDLFTVQGVSGEKYEVIYDKALNKFTVENVQESISIFIEDFENEAGDIINKIDYIKYSISVYINDEYVETVQYNSGSKFTYYYVSDYFEVTEWESRDVNLDLNNIKSHGSVYSKTVINKEYEIILYYDLDEEVKKITYLDCKEENGEYYYVLQNRPSVEGRIFIGWKLFVSDELVEMEKNEINFSDITNNSIVLVATWNILKPNNNLSYKSDNYIIFSIGYNNGDFAGNFEAEYNWYIIEENGEKTQILVGKELLQFATLGLQSGTYKIQCEARACYDGSASDWVQSEIYEITI